MSLFCAIFIYLGSVDLPLTMEILNVTLNASHKLIMYKQLT